MHESKLDDTLDAAAAQIQAGTTDRSQVRALLGEPMLSSTAWRFDLFRISDANWHVTFMILPVAVSSDERKGYLLVRYDDQGRVTESGRGVSKDWELAELEATDTSADAYLYSGNLIVKISDDGDESLVALDEAGRDEWMARGVPSDQCEVVVGCLDIQCAIEASVDDRPKAKLPVGSSGSSLFLIPSFVDAGHHTVRYSSSRHSLDFQGSQPFDCRAGVVTYLPLEFEFQSQSSAMLGLYNRSHYAVRITPTEQMPAGFAGQPLVLYLNGRWLVPKEPR